MANAKVGNTIYMDTAGAISTESNQKVTHIIFTPGAANDTCVIGETVSGGIKVKLIAATKQSMHLPFRDQPLVFAEGIALQSITSGASVTIVISSSGGA